MKQLTGMSGDVIQVEGRRTLPDGDPHVFMNVIDPVENPLGQPLMLSRADALVLAELLTRATGEEL